MDNLLKTNPAFLEAQPLLQKIRKSGFEAYFVGGSVRDAILNLPASNDIDIATSAMPGEIKDIFPRTVDVGIEHGTVLVLMENDEYEVTTFRVESTYSDYRRPDSVQFVRSLKEDLKRRDFTINAMAIDENGDLIDYFNGVNDLKQKIIQAVGNPKERFNEDALRMMRAVRFASQLDFNIERNTLDAISKEAHLLEKIAVERIYVEFIKLLLSKSISKGLNYMVATDLYQYCPHLSDSKDALLKLGNINQRLLNERMAWSMLLYFMGSFDQSEINSLLKAWKSSNKVIKDVSALIKGIHYRLDSERLSKKLLFELGEELSGEVEYMMGLLNFPSDVEEVSTLYANLNIHSKSDLAITGSDILKLTDKKPGKWLGDLIDQVLDLVINGDLSNDKRILTEYIQNEMK